ncbi:hypothetical protein HYALB_00001537 [Hymenoscyphus albidus]|uniref:Ankyrin n=1 Tax=Hymenoscyphus albidus TaxID=595503 RepID=A0A9N9LDM0_9HELO|nr:hypothetical protein HYALB_00001537 [Hymenoscyphus albidus]
MLLRTGANVEATKKRGQTALIVACSCGFDKVATILIKNGANIEAADSHGHTALGGACGYGFDEIATILIKNSANTSLMKAANEGHNKALKVLLEHGADVDTRDGGGNTALHDASHGDHFEALRFLLEHGAEFDVRDEDGNTALVFAASCLNVEGAEILIAAGADRKAVDLSDLSEFGKKVDSTREDREKRQIIVEILQGITNTAAPE